METSRALVYQTLEFSKPKRIPRDLWSTPWANETFNNQLAALQKDFPTDFLRVNGCYGPIPNRKAQGVPFVRGSYTDDWGITWHCGEDGVCGEVKEYLVKAPEWGDAAAIDFPLWMRDINKEEINRICRATDKFTIGGPFPDIFQKMQFFHGTENFFCDLMDPPPAMLDFLKRLHIFYCEVLEEFAKTEVDAIAIMDDWGTQRSLLISPELWVDYFKPIYKDYLDIAKQHGKKMFMHSDGQILDILPHLTELGLDALNLQIGCMDMERLRRFSGKLTFWGEVDRQTTLFFGGVEEVREEVTRIYENLYQDGGCIAQCEFAKGTKYENVRAVFEAWDAVHNASNNKFNTQSGGTNHGKNG